MLIPDSRDSVYLPYVKKNLRHSTYTSYIQLYEKRLKAHFAVPRLTSPHYAPQHSSARLTQLAKELGQ